MLGRPMGRMRSMGRMRPVGPIAFWFGVCQQPRLACLLLLAVIGCDRSPAVSVADPDVDRRQFAQAIAAGRWAEADQLSGPLLIAGAGDPSLLASVARVRYELDDPATASDLMIAACEAANFSDPAIYQQAVATLVAGGRLFDVIELNRAAVEAMPEQPTLRQSLVDWLVGVERHVEAGEVAQSLIRQRQFDADLLWSTLAWLKRDRESKSLRTMVDRNPDDPRPLIGEAKTAMDESRFRDANSTLEKIREKFSDDVVATAHLAQGYRWTGRWEELGRLLASQIGNAAAWRQPAMWSAAAAWADAGGHTGWATSAAARAVDLNGLDLDAHQLLLRLLQAAGDSDTGEVNALRTRTETLVRWRDALRRLEADRTDGPAAVAVVQSLVELGRPWEAEAWAAVQSVDPSFSEHDRRRLTNVRNRIVKQLTRQTPWQQPIAAIDRLKSSASPDQIAGWIENFVPPSGASGRPGKTGLTVAPRMVNQAAEWGLDFFGRTADGLQNPGVMLSDTLGCGGGTLDFDRDGRADLILRDAGGRPGAEDSRRGALLRNIGGRFVNVAAEAGAGDHRFGQGVAIGDLNADGFEDIVLLNYDADTLLTNNGDGTFTADEAALGGVVSWSTSGAIADFDSDGLSDLYIATYCDGLGPATIQCDAEGMAGHRSCSPMRFAAGQDRVFLTDPNGELRDQTARTIAAGPTGRGLGVMVLPGPVLPGLSDTGCRVLVANDMTANQLWQTGGGGWVDSAIAAGVGGDDRGRPQGSMGIAISDVDGDRQPDLYVTNFENESNSFHLADGGGWIDRTIVAGLSESTLPLVGFGTEWVDLDSNGVDELVVTNGHVDTFEKDGRRSPYAQPPQRFALKPGGRWEAIAADDEPYFQTKHVGRALWTGDFDDNGRVDLVVTHQTEPVALLMNQTPAPAPAHWITVELVGTAAARDAVTAAVRIVGRDGQTRWRTAGDGYLCRNDPRLIFGRGEDDSPVTIEVSWPGGDSQTYADLATDRSWLLVQGQPAWSHEPQPHLDGSGKVGQAASAPTLR